MLVYQRVTPLMDNGILICRGYHGCHWWIHHFRWWRIANINQLISSQATRNWRKTSPKIRLIQYISMISWRIGHIIGNAEILIYIYTYNHLYISEHINGKLKKLEHGKSDPDGRCQRLHRQFAPTDSSAHGWRPHSSGNKLTQAMSYQLLRSVMTHDNYHYILYIKSYHTIS